MRERFMIVPSGDKTYYHEGQALQEAERKILDNDGTALFVVEIKAVVKRMATIERLKNDVIGGEPVKTPMEEQIDPSVDVEDPGVPF